MPIHDVLRWITSREPNAAVSRDVDAQLDYKVQGDLLALVSDHPNVRFTVVEYGVRLEPAGSGLSIDVVTTEAKPRLVLAGWFDDLAWPDALVLIKMALKGDLRVRYDRLGHKSWQWAVELRSHSGTWHEASGQIYGPANFIATSSKSVYFKFSTDENKSEVATQVCGTTIKHEATTPSSHVRR
jgi:hypothetical protein